MAKHNDRDVTMAKHSKKTEWVGHGGVRCPCCRPRGYSTKEFKRLLSRTERRGVRIALAGLVAAARAAKVAP